MEKKRQREISWKNNQNKQAEKNDIITLEEELCEGKLFSQGKCFHQFRYTAAKRNKLGKKINNAIKKEDIWVYKMVTITGKEILHCLIALIIL